MEKASDADAGVVGEESVFVGLLGAKDRMKTDMSPVRDIHEYDVQIVGKMYLLRCTSGDAEYQCMIPRVSKPSQQIEITRQDIFFGYWRRLI